VRPQNVTRGCSKVRFIPATAQQFRDIEPLGAKHDKLRVAFSCGVEPLDRYLKRQASQDAKERVAAPYVLVSLDNRIAGYYTLSSTSVRVDDLPPELLKRLKLPRYPAIGATLVGRLARDLSFRGLGIGELLLTDALKVSLAMSRKIAPVGVVVDAKDDNARRLYAEFGFIAFSETEKRLLLRMEAIEELFAHSIE
jgi:predicted GNAT family N-acyltransferase